MDKNVEKRLWIERNPVRLARLKHDLSRTKLAELAGITNKGLYFIEHGITYEPRWKSMFDIADALGEDASELKEAIREWRLENPDRKEEEEDGQDKGS